MFSKTVLQLAENSISLTAVSFSDIALHSEQSSPGMKANQANLRSQHAVITNTGIMCASGLQIWCGMFSGMNLPLLEHATCTVQ